MLIKNFKNLKWKMKKKFGLMIFLTVVGTILCNLLLILEAFVDPDRVPFLNEVRQQPKTMLALFEEAVRHNDPKVVKILLAKFAEEGDFRPFIRVFPTPNLNSGFTAQSLIYWAIHHCYTDVVRTILTHAQKSGIEN